MSTAVVWFRHDLRLHDNPALRRASETHDHIIPIYIHAPEEETPWASGAASRWWLHHSLEVLNGALQEFDSRLVLRRGGTLDEIRTVIQATDASAVYWNRRYEPAVIDRDKALEKALREQGIAVEHFNAALLFEPWAIEKEEGGPYQIFTPFWKTCTRQLPPADPQPRPSRIPAPATWPDSLSLEALALMPDIHWYEGMDEAWQPGGAGARAQLEYFSESILDDYPRTRNLPAIEGVSRLSPHLHFGEVSPRQIWAAVSRWVEGDPLEYKASEAFFRQLGWREFAYHVLYHWPRTPEQPMQERFNAYPWRRDYGKLLQAWQQGRTGYPLVDAGMRELWHTGWMHNRLRMIVASFLTKNCRIPWQEGERWFWDTLVDADLANNTLGWQWTTGCGTDAAPYFRIFNPVRQSEQLDPEGTYLRRWVPELAKLPDRWLHRPWEAPTTELNDAGLTLGKNYPKPIVDLEISRAEALEGYERIKEQS